MPEPMFEEAGVTMRAAVIRDLGDPRACAVERVRKPVPGRGEILVEIDTAGVSFGDTLIVTGRYQSRPALPFIAGTEGAGIVRGLGEGAAGFVVGDHVAVCGFIGDPRATPRILGTYAEYACVPVGNALRVPDGVLLERAAIFRANTESSAFALHKGRLAAGETLLVLGAGGGTGFAAVELGKLARARVIASASNEEKRRIALDAGADVAVDSRDPGWRDQVKRLTGGRGIDVVFDPVGGEHTERAFRALAWNGRLVVVGFAAGAVPALPTNLALLKGAALVGANLLEGVRHEPEFCAAEARRLMTLFGEGRLRVPPIRRRYPLADATAAIADVAAGMRAGRVVIAVR